MKRILLICLVLVCACASADPIEFQEGPRNHPVSGLTPFPTQSDQNTGFIETMATYTFSVGTASAVLCPRLAPNTKIILVHTNGDDLFWGGSDVASSTDDFIPDGYSRGFSGLATTTPNIWFRPGSKTTIVTIRCIGRGDL